MIICNSLKYIYIHIHKTGGTSLEKAINPHLHWNDLILGSTDHGEQQDSYYSRRYSINKHSSLSDVYKACGKEIESYKTFTLIRHPINRACSLYNYIASIVEKKLKAKNLTRQKVLSLLNTNPDSLPYPLNDEWPAILGYLNVDGDINAFFKNKKVLSDRGMISQFSMLAINNQISNNLELFKLEDISNSLQSIRRIVGGEIIMPRANASRLKIATPKSLKQETIEYLSSHYAIDFEAFDYRIFST